jgi:hypothetical protein
MLLHSRLDLDAALPASAAAEIHALIAILWLPHCGFCMVVIVGNYNECRFRSASATSCCCFLDAHLLLLAAQPPLPWLLPSGPTAYSGCRLDHMLGTCRHSSFWRSWLCRCLQHCQHQKLQFLRAAAAVAAGCAPASLWLSSL